MRAAVAGLVLALALVAQAEHRGLPVLGMFPQSVHRGGAQSGATGISFVPRPPRSLARRSG